MPPPTLRSLLLILAVCGVCFFLRLGDPKLWDRDEPRNARCAQEMLERGDWIVPTFNGELRAHKPILLYWLMMLAYGLFGVNEFAARFWSAALASGTVLLTYAMGRRLFDAGTAIWAAVILATTLMFNVAAHAATPDAALIFCTTLGMSCFVAALSWGDRSSRTNPAAANQADRRWMVLAGVALGLGVLVKGPVGLVLPVLTWCFFVWSFGARTGRWQIEPKRWLASRLRPTYVRRCCSNVRLLLVTGVSLAIAAPWYIVVGRETDGAWLYEFFVRHNISRAVLPMEGHSGGLLWFYPAAILIGFFPWSAFTIPAAIWVARRGSSDNYDRRFGFLLSWVLIYVAAFSLAATKLPSYVTPIYPALALMVGHFVAQWPRCAQRPAVWWPRWSAATYIVVGSVLAAALPWAARTYLPGEERLGAIGIVLVLGGCISGWQFFQGQRSSGFLSMAVSGLCFIVAVFGWVAPRVSDHQQIEQLVATARQLDHSAKIATAGVHEPSWVFYFGQTLPELTPESDEIATQLEHWPGMAITTRRQFESCRDLLPHDLVVLDQVPYFLKTDDLVLVGIVASTTSFASSPPSQAPSGHRR